MDAGTIARRAKEQAEEQTMRCPGQDPAYWREDAVFETPCPKCEAAVEFFKDESSGCCRSCGHRFRNPKVSFDCAKWCTYAEQCVGSAPERELTPNPGEGTLASRLIRVIKEEFQADQARIAPALTVFQYARELLSKEGGDPRITLAAALLLGMGTAQAKQILQGIGLEEGASESVCRIISRYRMGEDVDTVEFKIVSDAAALAKLAAERPSDDLDKLQDIVKNGLKTKTGKEKARSLPQISPGGAGG